MYKKFFKRFFDIILSLIAIIILSPVYLIISILVLIFMGWPILFKQPRPGKNEKIFNMYKFRTMTNKKDKDGNLLPDEQRLPKFGRFLRKTSLDELPEIFSIFIGKMSIVGPRPLVVQYLPYYTEEEHHRHDVRPGLTGWAQVNGRNNLSWDDRFKLDIEYVNNISLIFDIKIIFLTIKKVIKASDINVRGTGKMMDFDEYRREQNELNRKKVILRELRESDMTLFNSLMNCSDVEQFVVGWCKPVTMHEQISWFQNLKNDDNIRYTIANVEDNEIFGTLIISKIDWKNRSCGLDIKLSSDSRGKGIGSESVSIATNYIFNELNLNRIGVRILDSNIPSQKLFKKNGFIEEGKLRNAIYKNGKYDDLLIFSILKEDFLNERNR